MTAHIGSSCCAISPGQAMETSLQRTWHIGPNEPSRRTLAQPNWKTLLQQSKQQQPPMPTLHELRRGASESDSTPSPSLWSAPDGYQSSTDSTPCGMQQGMPSSRTTGTWKQMTLMTTVKTGRKASTEFRHSSRIFG